MRIALISDLHGNDHALAAVFADIDRHGVDETICLGDVATLGPRPADVIDRLQRERCRCVLGNHDAFMLDAELIRTYTEVPIVVEAVDWCRDRLSASDLEFLSGFRTSIPMELAPGISAFWYHGTPRSHMEDLLATLTPEQVDECLAGTSATVMAGGHTHLQMLRQHRGILIANPGSVGMPFRQFANGCAPEILPHAEYAVVEADSTGVSVSLRRVTLDKAELKKEAADSSNPICRALELQYS